VIYIKEDIFKVKGISACLLFWKYENYRDRGAYKKKSHYAFAIDKSENHTYYGINLRAFPRGESLPGGIKKTKSLPNQSGRRKTHREECPAQ